MLALDTTRKASKARKQRTRLRVFLGARVVEHAQRKLSPIICQGRLESVQVLANSRRHRRAKGAPRAHCIPFKSVSAFPCTLALCVSILSDSLISKLCFCIAALTEVRTTAWRRCAVHVGQLRVLAGTTRFRSHDTSEDSRVSASFARSRLPHLSLYNFHYF